MHMEYVELLILWKFGVNNLCSFHFMSKKRKLDDFFSLSMTQSLTKVVGAKSKNCCIIKPPFCNFESMDIPRFCVGRLKSCANFDPLPAPLWHCWGSQWPGNHIGYFNTATGERGLHFSKCLFFAPTLLSKIVSQHWN